MALFLLIVGLVFLVPSVRGKDATTQLTTLVKSDFTGPNNFFVWAIAIGFIAALGSIQSMRKLSNAFLVLVLVALIIQNSKAGNNPIVAFFNQIKSTQG